VTGILLLAFHFPPLGGPGTQRSAKFARDLNAMGYRPTIVTGPGDTSGRWDPLDETLLREVPADVPVLRVPGPVPAGGGRLERWTGRPGSFFHWWVDGAVAAARGAIRSADLIYASMAPYETAFAAGRLAAESGLPWIADLRDPWALDEMRVYPSAVHRHMDLRRMREALSTAHAIIMNTAESARALVAAIPELALKPVLTLPNGYDAWDFPADAPRVPDGPLRIVHTGSLHTELGARHARSRAVKQALGGAEQVDILARSHVHLVRAIQSLAHEGIQPGRDVELHLAGAVTEADRAAVDMDGVVFHGYLEHAASVELLRSADLLFLPMHGLAPPRRARIVPGKTYEYLAAGRPILAAVPDGDARDLVAGAPGAQLCRPGDVAALARAVAAAIRHKQRHGPRPSAWHPALARYERRRLAGELAGLVETLAPGRRCAAERFPHAVLRIAGSG
jgi:glycosyltransferase involved in cell wall biosynthesis